MQKAGLDVVSWISLAVVVGLAVVVAVVEWLRFR
jgi:hypothetical protein